MAKLNAARVLCDIPSHGLKAGQIVEASPDLIQALAKSGEIDPHKDAVAYARSEGAAVVRSSFELAEQQRRERIDALRVEIAQLEDLAAKPETDAPTKGAMTAKAAELKAELAALGA